MKRNKVYLYMLLFAFTLTLALPSLAANTVDIPHAQPAAADELACGSCGVDLTWRLSADGTLTISGTGKMDDYLNGSTMPWDEYREVITTVTVQDGVTFLDAFAFSNCDNLTKATLAASVTEIGGWLFSDCEQMKTAGPVGGGYNIEYEWTQIPENAFMMCDALTYVYIPETVTSIGENAFDYCYNLSTAGPGDGIFDPETCTGTYGIEFGWTDKIPDKAFLDCEGLMQITLPETLTTIGQRAFEASGLTSITIPDSVTTIGNSAFEFSAIRYLKIGRGLEVIGPGAFSHCLELSGVTIPGTVRTIGYSAFNFCKNLKDVILEEGIETIETYAFKNCALDSLLLPSTINAIGSYTLDAPSICFLGNSPSDISENAFNRNTVLYRFRDTIWSQWFWYRDDSGKWARIDEENEYETALQDTFIWGPSADSHWTVNTVYAAAFDTQPESNIVYTGDTVTFTASFTGVPTPDIQWQIDCGDGNGWVDIDGATSAAYTIESAELAHSGLRYRCVITNYGGTAVSDPATLTVVRSIIASGTCGENLTWKLDGAGILTISGEGAMDNYGSSSATPWYTYRSDITSLIIGDGVTTIGTSAFSYCGNLVSVAIGSHTAIIGNFAFYNCTSLAGIIIPDSVTSINEGAFYNCSSLASATIGNGLVDIGYGAFQNCTNLAKITIPDSVITLGDQAFYNCTSLTDITIGSGVTAIGNLAFQYCTNLTDILIPESVTTLGNQVFCYCYSLGSLTIPESVTLIGKYAFYSCNALNTVYYAGIEKQWRDVLVETGNECLTNAVFIFAEPEVIASGTCGADGDNLIWTLREDDTLTISGTGAMADFNLIDAPWNSNFNHVVDIVIEDGVTNISKGAFILCTHLVSICIPESVTFIGESVFHNCDRLQTVYFGGSEDQWNNIVIDNYNDPLVNADIIFAVIPIITMGDVNEDGSVNIRDSIFILNAIGEKLTDSFTSIQAIASDVNYDGTISVRDVIIILQAIASKTTDQL